MSFLVAALILAAPSPATMDDLENGRFAQAEERLMQKRQSGIWDLQDQLVLAAACLGKGDLDCAAFLYNETLEPEPRTALAYFGLAEIERLRGHFPAAAIRYQSYLDSSLPGRTAGYDKVAEQRLAAIQAGAQAGPEAPSGWDGGPRNAQHAKMRPPKFGALSWASTRWASIAFFPAIFGGILVGAVAAELTNSGETSVLIGLGTGAAIFGGAVGWGMERVANRRGYTGAWIKAGAASVAIPILAFTGGAFLDQAIGFDSELSVSLAFGVAAGGIAIAVPMIYMTDLRPIGAEEGTGDAQGGVPSVVGGN
jgi:hypothetical protein